MWVYKRYLIAVDSCDACACLCVCVRLRTFWNLFLSVLFGSYRSLHSLLIAPLSFILLPFHESIVSHSHSFAGSVCIHVCVCVCVHVFGAFVLAWSLSLCVWVWCVPETQVFAYDEYIRIWHTHTHCAIAVFCVEICFVIPFMRSDLKMSNRIDGAR